MERRQRQTTARNTGSITAITRASRHWMEAMIPRAPRMVTPEMNTSSGPWWASSVMLNRSAVSLLMSCPVRLRS